MNLRSRRGYLIAIPIVIAAGLASRHFRELLPTVVYLYAGDALWASCIYLGLRAGWPRWPKAQSAALALAVSVAVELSQLVHTPWLDALRSQTWVGLVLGQGFVWGDLACYAAGVGLAWAVDRSFGADP